MADPTRMTLATPIMIPRRVRKVRSLWARRESQASPAPLDRRKLKGVLEIESTGMRPKGYSNRDTAGEAVSFTNTYPAAQASQPTQSTNMDKRFLRPLLIAEF